MCAIMVIGTEYYDIRSVYSSMLGTTNKKASRHELITHIGLAFAARQLPESLSNDSLHLLQCRNTTSLAARRTKSRSDDESTRTGYSKHVHV